MSATLAGFYARWRIECQPECLREAPGERPPEKFLQTIWFHQRIQRDNLRTMDGRKVRVLHPGFWNREAGPDFRGAVLQFGGELPVAGDVEIDLNPACWTAHEHHRNPNFARVALHVVWEAPRSAGTHNSQNATQSLPVLAIKDLLDAPLEQLRQWLNIENASSFPEQLAGKCHPCLIALSEKQRNALLEQAASVRLQAKAHQLACRARQAGWEQALWEGMFRALGYKKNVWPMQALAELRRQLLDGCESRLHLQARLLGVGGLLPPELTRTRPPADTYLRRIWDYWWRERDSFSECQLSSKTWQISGMRPSNQPARRLALASQWWLDSALPQKLQKWLSEATPQRPSPQKLLFILQGKSDEFWSWHLTLKSERLPQPLPLLGQMRATDLAINVILPWFMAQATETGNDALRQQVEKIYLAWPAAEDNATLKLARLRLLSGLGARALSRAALQQGLLQIVRDYCDNAGSLCENCRFPEVIEAWRKACAENKHCPCH